jgi:hypothetical protein
VVNKMLLNFVGTFELIVMYKVSGIQASLPYLSLAFVDALAARSTSHSVFCPQVNNSSQV